VSVPQKPGIYPGVSFDEYALIPAINFTILSKFRDTAAHARVVMLQDKESTPSQHLGQLVHLALLEPDRFEATVAVRPDLDRRTKEGKAAWAAFELKNSDKEIASKREIETCRGLIHSCAQHATARELLRGPGASELTIVWQDPEYGVLCKSRIDRLGTIGGASIVADVKTTSDTASLRNWQRSLANYSYPEQAAMYLAGLRELRPLPEGQGDRGFIWVVAEVEPPYAVRLFQIEYDALEYGHGMFREHLRQYTECVETGSWPAYSEGVEVAGLPAWLQKAFDATL
jgi:hypothetical protein